MDISLCASSFACLMQRMISEHLIGPEIVPDNSRITGSYALKNVIYSTWRGGELA